MFAKFGLRTRIFGAVTLFLVPLSYVTWSLLTLQLSEIRIAEDERVGNRYLIALDEAQAAVNERARNWDYGVAADTNIAGANIAGANVAAVAARLRAAEAAFGQSYGTAADADKAAGLLDALGAASRPDRAKTQALSEALSKIRERVLDLSGLILDPKLDSYHMMDLAGQVLPALSEAVRTLGSHGQRFSTSQGGEEARVQLLVAGGAFDLVRLRFERTVERVLENVERPEVRRHIEQGRDRVTAAIDRLANTLRQTAFGDPVGGDLKELEAAAAGAIAALSQVATADLETLLADRSSADRAASLTVLLLAAFSFCLAVAAIYALLSHGVFRPLDRMTAALTRLAAGDVTVAVDPAGGGEVGRMAKAVLTLRASIEERQRLEEERNATRARIERTELARGALTEDFDRTSGAVLGAVSAAVAELRQASRQVHDEVTVAAHRSGSVVEAAGRAASAVETARQSSQDLDAATTDIAGFASAEAEIAERAVAAVERVETAVERLGSIAGGIDQVVATIAAIASQTNLLALNATIEAARAGDAGAGFAVVASEVKGLARETSHATEEVGGQIKAVQQAVADATGLIRELGGTIRDLHAASRAIQLKTSRQIELAASIVTAMGTAETGASTVTQDIADVRTAVASTDRLVARLTATAETLDREFHQLRQRTETFLHGVRTAEAA
jgi:methyl-accepting chemotaxis protein